MNEVKELFEAIGKSDVDANQTGLLDNGIIDSLDMLALIREIEKKYGMLAAKFIEAENFESFETIAKMIKDAYGK